VILPSGFEINYPPDTSGMPVADLQPTFLWGQSTDIDPLDYVLYTLIIALDSNFNFSNEIEDITETEYAITYDLELGEQYWWKVKAEDQFGGFIWSDNIRSFWIMLCGDANNDKTVNVLDAIYIINYVFIGGNPPVPLESGDVNYDGTCNVSNAVWIINYVFVGGNEPCDTDNDSVPDC
jgi:Dockerin type I domain